MPELPEVEFARRFLTRALKGKTIARARVLDRRIVDGNASRLDGQRVGAIARRGKWLRISVGELLVFSHLGMTGKWVRGGREPLRFERVRLELDKGVVSYLDPRLFGTFAITDDDLPAWRALGPDPLVDGIDVDALHARLAKKSIAIKPALLDQTLLAGVGNIQATEALFFARIDPRRKCSSLSRRDVGAVVRGIDRSIAKTLAHESGPSITYVEEAGAPNPFTIYGREGEPCPRCKRPLTKIVLAGRGTVLCEHDQR